MAIARATCQMNTSQPMANCNIILVFLRLCTLALTKALKDLIRSLFISH